MTSVSERCSRAVVKDHATLVLYDYISRTNRSRPALEVGNICISILLNLCKVSVTHGRSGWSIFIQIEFSTLLMWRRRSRGYGYYMSLPISIAKPSSIQKKKS